MTIENPQVDTTASIEDNNPEVGGNAATVQSGAGVSAPEDTPNEWQNIIEAKDSIISAYEKQVASLKSQVANLVRNGATISESNSQSGDKGQVANDNPLGNPLGNSLGGFGSGFGTGEKFGDFKDLGKEIGKRD